MIKASSSQDPYSMAGHSLELARRRSMARSRENNVILLDADADHRG